MGKQFDGIDERLAEWIRAQHLFFVASAPLEQGRIPADAAGWFRTA